MSEYRRFGQEMEGLVKKVRDPGELAFIGYQDASGNYITTDPSNPMYVWVRIGGDPRFVRKANNAQGVPPDPNLPVRVGIPPGKHELHILGADESAVTYYGGRVPGIVAPHSHEFGALWDPVSIRRFKPGLVEAKQFGGTWTMNVYINPFITFRKDGTLLIWKGGWVDLTSSIPSAGQRRWVLVGVNLMTAFAEVTNGPPYGLPMTLSVDQLLEIDLGDMLPLAGVNVYYGMTEVREADLTDARPFPVMPFGSSSGTVTPPSAGEWDPDLKPETPNADDDEFDDATLAVDWTEVDPDSVLTVTEAADVLTLATSGYSDELTGVKRDVPAGSWQVVVKLTTRIAPTDGLTADWLRAGFALTFPTYVGRAVAGVQRVAVGDDLLKFGVSDIGVWGFGPVDATEGYLRLRYDAVNTAMSINWSADGVNWTSQGYDLDAVGEAPDEIWLTLESDGTAEVDYEFYRVRDGYGTSTDPVYGRNEDVTASAANVSYTPGDGTDWTDPDPTTVQGALDALAAGGSGALADHDHSGDAGDGGTFDAANLTSGAAGEAVVEGASELDDLTDVDLTTPPTDGQALVYDGGSSTWQAGTIAAGAVLTVKEADGTPEVADVGTIVVTNGTLTDDGGGQVTLDFGNAATDGSAIHDNEAGEIAALTEKTTPANSDWLLVEDSADSNNKKKVQVGNLPGGTGGADILEMQVFS